jgi:hypothetical protein
MSSKFLETFRRNVPKEFEKKTEDTLADIPLAGSESGQPNVSVSAHAAELKASLKKAKNDFQNLPIGSDVKSRKLKPDSTPKFREKETTESESTEKTPSLSNVSGSSLAQAKQTNSLQRKQKNLYPKLDFLASSPSKRHASRAQCYKTFYSCNL